MDKNTVIPRPGLAWPVLLICLLMFQGLGQAQSARVLRVGIYDNPPKLFSDPADGTPKGIFPGIVSQIASLEGWTIQFVPVSFKQGLEALRNGSLDIMQDVAWSEERSKIYAFTSETVMVSWGRVYRQKGHTVNTLIDLKDKRIAVMDGGIYGQGPDGLKPLLEKFELQARFIPVKNYRQVFQALEEDRADVGVVNRLYGKLNKGDYPIENTPILISPISIRFALSRANPDTPELARILDTHLARMKQDSTSVYYTLIDEYIGQPRTVIPPLVKNLILALLVFSLFFAALGILSSRQVRKKTRQLNRRDAALMENEKKFRSIFENLQDVYFNTTVEGKIKTISPSIQALSGYTPEELSGRNVTRAYQDPSRRDAMLLSLEKDGQVRDYEIQLKKKGGQPYWVSINADLYAGPDGAPAGITGTIRDITERKKAQAQLQKKQERFSEMARLLPCAIVEADLDLNITYTNQTGLAMFGYSQQDLDSGINGRDVIHPDDLGLIESLVEQHMDGKSTPPTEFRMRTKDGDPMSVLLNSTGILNQGLTVGFRASLMDLSETKRLQNQILRSQKLESTGILAGGIAHDFNNILLGLFGNLSLAKGELSSKDRAFILIEEAEKSMARAKDLTAQLLTFAQGGDPVKKDFPLDQIVRETALFHLSGSNVKVEMKKTEGLWQVRADKGQISQVIANLVINARQAMPSGGQLNITLENTAISENEFSAFELGRYVKLSIEDQGIGIAEKHLEKIFDPYFTTKQDGSGLGLSIVHSIILKHGGYIFVNSTPGKGTAFIIHLPVAGETAASALEPPRTASPASARIPVGPGLRVLVMDDEPLVRDVSRRMMGKLGHSTTLCKDGETCVQAFKEAMEKGQPYDLVIMDLTIPGGMGGEAAIKQVLAMDPEARVVLASGYSNDPVLADYQAHGFKAVVTKPYTVDSVKMALSKAMT